MKFGLICEGVQDGADERTLRCLIRRLRPDLEFVILPLGNKPKLKEDCGRTANRLINTDGCTRVGIVWDLFPDWGRPTDCTQDDAEVLASLQKADVNVALVERLCVVAEIETWLLMDHNAIASVISRPTRPKSVSRIRDALTNTSPKNKLRSIFRNKKAIAAAADLDRLKRCPSFDEFDNRVLP